MCYDDRSLIAYIDGELSYEEAASLEEHLHVCPGCRERLEKFQATDALIEAYVQQIAAVADRYFDLDAAWNRFVQRLQEQQRRRAWYQRFTWPRVLGVAAACLLVISIALGIRYGNEEPTPTQVAQVPQTPAAEAPATSTGKADAEVEAERPPLEAGAGLKQQVIKAQVSLDTPKTESDSSCTPEGLRHLPPAPHTAATQMEGQVNNRGNGGRHPLLPLKENDVMSVILHRPQHDPVIFEDAATVRQAVYLINTCTSTTTTADAVSAQAPDPGTAPALEIRLKTGECIKVTQVNQDTATVLLPGEKMLVRIPELGAFLEKLGVEAEAE